MTSQVGSVFQVDPEAKTLDQRWGTADMLLVMGMVHALADRAMIDLEQPEGSEDFHDVVLLINSSGGGLEKLEEDAGG